MALTALVRLRTVFALGLGNVARVASYRLRLRTGRHPVQRLPEPEPARPPYFHPPTPDDGAPTAPPGLPAVFGWIALDERAGPPPWHRHLLSGTSVADRACAWWRIPDYDPTLGDIKAVWEPSRLDWALRLAQRARGGEAAGLERLEEWLTDWCEQNPPYRGPNWKCGQESSLRVLHLGVACLVLGGYRAARPALLQLIRAHLARIAPTMDYAIGQDNNHGTSEAAALFVGGSWLRSAGDATAGAWEATGRRWLEERAKRLFLSDGTFSQYSVNYHRVALDTYGIAEVWRRHLDLPPFGAPLRARLAEATAWLRGMVDPERGDAPNIGANDGANLLPLTDTGFRDYRPAVQLAAALWHGRRAWADPGPWDDHLRWLGVRVPADAMPPLTSSLHDDGGFALLRQDRACAVLRYPRFRFRPSHADPLHVDLTVSGENLLRDAGSFSYAADESWQLRFAGIAGHTTVQFDDREPMPRLGRFLWGDWIETEACDPIETDAVRTAAGAAYRDRVGARHHRRVVLESGQLRVIDTVAGFATRAVWRWRLRPGPWTVSGRLVTDGRHRIAVEASMPLLRCEIVDGWESRWYLRKDPAPVLEIECREPGSVTTVYHWKE